MVGSIYTAGNSADETVAPEVKFPKIQTLKNIVGKGPDYIEDEKPEYIMFPEFAHSDLLVLRQKDGSADYYKYGYPKAGYGVDKVCNFKVCGRHAVLHKIHGAYVQYHYAKGG